MYPKCGELLERCEANPVGLRKLMVKWDTPNTLPYREVRCFKLQSIKSLILEVRLRTNGGDCHLGGE